MAVAILGCLSTCMAYDALDPTGNVTIIWDVMGWAEDGYLAKVNIYNYQQFRKIEKPGWALTWNWTNGEFIWDMSVSVGLRRLPWPHVHLFLDVVNSVLMTVCQSLTQRFPYSYRELRQHNKGIVPKCSSLEPKLLTGTCWGLSRQVPPQNTRYSSKPSSSQTS